MVAFVSRFPALSLQDFLFPSPKKRPLHKIFEDLCICIHRSARCYMLDFSIYLKRCHFTREQIEWAEEMWDVSKDKKNWESDHHWSRFPCDPELVPEHFSNRFSPFSEPLLGVLLTYQRSADIIRSQSHYGPIEESQRIKLLHNIFIITLHLMHKLVTGGGSRGGGTVG